MKGKDTDSVTNKFSKEGVRSWPAFSIKFCKALLLNTVLDTNFSTVVISLTGIQNRIYLEMFQ